MGSVGLRAVTSGRNRLGIRLGIVWESFGNRLGVRLRLPDERYSSVS